MSGLNLPPGSPLGPATLQTLIDALKRWSRNGIGADNITDGSITSAKILDGTIVAADTAPGTFLELLVAGTARKIAFGSGTMTFDGSGAFSNQGASGLVVAHGMGLTPIIVLVTLGATSGVTNFCSAPQVRTVGGTNFTVQVNTTDGSTPDRKSVV